MMGGETGGGDIGARLLPMGLPARRCVQLGALSSRSVGHYSPLGAHCRGALLTTEKDVGRASPGGLGLG